MATLISFTWCEWGTGRCKFKPYTLIGKIGECNHQSSELHHSEALVIVVFEAAQIRAFPELRWIFTPNGSLVPLISSCQTIMYVPTHPSLYDPDLVRVLPFLWTTELRTTSWFFFFSQFLAFRSWTEPGGRALLVVKLTSYSYSYLLKRPNQLVVWTVTVYNIILFIIFNSEYWLSEWLRGYDFVNGECPVSQWALPW